MVSKEIIIKSIEEGIEKCYPKETALKGFNERDFNREVYLDGDINSEVIPSPVGFLQQKQAEAQEEIEYGAIERGVLRCYSCDSFIPINSYLNGVKDWENDMRILFKLYDFNDGRGKVMPILNSPNNDGRGEWVDMTIPEQIGVLDNIMEKSPRVQRNTLVYRYGELPIDIKVGEHGRLKGFTSTSYNSYVAFKDIVEGGAWVQGEKDVRYKMRMFVPSGTKGVVLNRHNGCVDWQSELLLDRNQRYVVLAKDDVNMTADILIY